MLLVFNNVLLQLAVRESGKEFAEIATIGGCLAVPSKQNACRIVFYRFLHDCVR